MARSRCARISVRPCSTRRRTGYPAPALGGAAGRCGATVLAGHDRHRGRPAGGGSRPSGPSDGPRTGRRHRSPRPRRRARSRNLAQPIRPRLARRSPCSHQELPREGRVSEPRCGTFVRHFGLVHRSWSLAGIVWSMSSRPARPVVVFCLWAAYHSSATAQTASHGAG